MAEDDPGVDEASDFKPPRQGIWGTVRDAVTKETVIEATVQVLTKLPGGKKKRVQTDLDGRFKLSLPAGKYDLRVYAPLYKGQKIEGVIVESGATEVSVALKPDGAVDEVVVQAQADTRKESALLAERKRAAAVSDGVSQQEMQRAPDGQAADAAKRVVSATVIDGRYVLVRGLGGRYVTALLNRVVLPSPEPDANAVPLDLFPTSLLANLQVVKAWTPDLPGAFGGGAFLMETQSLPQQRELRIRLGVTSNTETDFRTRKAAYTGGAADWLGWGTNSRSLDGIVPRNRPIMYDERGVTADEGNAVGRKLSKRYDAESTTSLPALNLAVSGAGTGSALGAKLGWLAQASLNHREQRRLATVQRVRTEDGKTAPRDQAKADNGSEQAQVGGVVQGGADWSGKHRLTVLGLYTHVGEHIGQKQSGYDETANERFVSHRQQFLEREMWFGQLVGRHTLGKQRVQLDWQASLAQTGRDEPDTRDISYAVTPAGRLRFRQGPASGEHFGASLSETQSAGGLHMAVPLEQKTWSLEPAVGAAVQAASRSFSARRFRYQFVGDDPSVLFQPPEKMFAGDNVGNAFRLDERTLANDAYNANRQVLAGYGLVDLRVASDRFRLQPGLRWEQANQEIDTGTRYATDGGELRNVTRSDAHLLPAVNATVQLKKDMQLRAGWSRTVARPQFRELAPMLYYDFVRRRNLSGNPDLLPTTIQNADLRWEWFPSADEVFSLGAFWKGLSNPIEQVVTNASQGDLSFANATSATVAGGEAEARLSLGRLSSALTAFRVGLSVAVIASEVDLTSQSGPQTSKTRPLQGQSPYAINASLLWRADKTRTDVALLYNVSGARIAEVGFDTLSDVYDQPQHRLDLTVTQALGKQLGLRLALQNLLLADQVLLADNVEVLRVPQGITAGLQLTWSPLQ